MRVCRHCSCHHWFWDESRSSETWAKFPLGERGSYFPHNFFSQEASDSVFSPLVWIPHTRRAISSKHVACRCQNRREYFDEILFLENKFQAVSIVSC